MSRQRQRHRLLRLRRRIIKRRHRHRLRRIPITRSKRQIPDENIRPNLGPITSQRHISIPRNPDRNTARRHVIQHNRKRRSRTLNNRHRRLRHRHTRRTLDVRRVGRRDPVYVAPTDFCATNVSARCIRLSKSFSL